MNQKQINRIARKVMGWTKARHNKLWFIEGIWVANADWNPEKLSANAHQLLEKVSEDWFITIIAHKDTGLPYVGLVHLDKQYSCVARTINEALCGAVIAMLDGEGL